MNALNKDSVISARGLRKQYGKQVAIAGISFDIAPGRIVGLIGPNGSGKTTTLKAILGLTGFEGNLSVLGRDPRVQRDALMDDVCFIADVAILPGWLRVADAIDFVAGVHPRFDRSKAERYLAHTKLAPKMKVKAMSKGMVVQLHLALVMAIDAKLLVLDEPTLGLDILYRKQFYQNLLEDYFDENKTIVITTHQIEEVEHILSDLMFIRDGKIVLASSMEEVGERYIEVMVGPQHVNPARALQPISERSVFGKSVMLFDGVDDFRAARAEGARVEDGAPGHFLAIDDERRAHLGLGDGGYRHQGAQHGHDDADQGGRPHQHALVFPQFTPDQPLHLVGRGNTHWYDPFMVATNRSARLGVRTSPRAATWVRATPSNSITDLPNTLRSLIGCRARAGLTCCGPTITSM